MYPEICSTKMRAHLKAEKFDSGRCKVSIDQHCPVLNSVLVNFSVLLTFSRGVQGECPCQLRKSFLKNIEVINIIVLYHLQIDSGKPGKLFSPFPSCPGSDVGPADRFK